MHKHVLRSQYLEKRKQLSIPEKKLFEEKIKKNLLENFSFSGRMTSCFLPIYSKNELDTWGIISSIVACQGDVVLPVWNFETNFLEHRLYSEDTKIVENSFGIPEPQNGAVISNTAIDFVLVPLLVVDRKGARVGYGKGVYDRFLAACSPTTIFIGLSFFELVDSIDDIDIYDVPLNYCITPTHCYSFEK